MVGVGYVSVDTQETSRYAQAVDITYRDGVAYCQAQTNRYDIDLGSALNRLKELTSALTSSGVG